jgi:hydrogenase maturation factor HypF (carbamoyltransferase family)
MKFRKVECPYCAKTFKEPDARQFYSVPNAFLHAKLQEFRRRYGAHAKGWELLRDIEELLQEGGE